MLNALQTKKFEALAAKPHLSAFLLAQNGTFGCRRGAGVGYFDPVANKTFVSWPGGGMDVFAASFDHGTKQWENAKRLRRNHMHGTWDYHNYPVMLKAPDGRCLLFYARHTKKLYQLSPQKAHTIAGRFGRRTICRDQCCYPYPVVAGTELYLFYSKNDDAAFPYRTLRYIKSDDSGQSWSAPKTVIDTEKADPLRFEEVYQGGASFAPAGAGYPARIQLAFTMWGGPKGHAQQGKGAYFAYLSLEDFHIYGADGTDCGETLHLEAMERHCLVEIAPATDAISHTCGGVLCGVLPDGSPLLCYSQRDGETPQGRIVAARLRDGVWMKETMDTGTYTLKDCKAADDGTVRVVYCKGRHCVVRRWNGTVWEMESATELPLPNGVDCVPWVNFIEHAQPEAQLLLSEIELQKSHKNYKGIWPVFCLGSSNHMKGK